MNLPEPLVSALFVSAYMLYGVIRAHLRLQIAKRFPQMPRNHGPIVVIFVVMMDNCESPQFRQPLHSLK
jgi:hypothetical protein